MHLAWVARARSMLTLRPMGGRVTLPPREEGPLLPLSLQTYLTESVYNVVLLESIPAQICQLILHYF